EREREVEVESGRASVFGAEGGLDTIKRDARDDAPEEVYDEQEDTFLTKMRSGTRVTRAVLLDHVLYHVQRPNGNRCLEAWRLCEEKTREREEREDPSTSPTDVVSIIESRLGTEYITGLKPAEGDESTPYCRLLVDPLGIVDSITLYYKPRYAESPVVVEPEVEPSEDEASDMSDMSDSESEASALSFQLESNGYEISSGAAPTAPRRRSVPESDGDTVYSAADLAQMARVVDG
ncbi:hypothetical protein KIPB_010594, partial [Kipferlia bialata]